MSGKFIVLFAVLAVCTLQMDEVAGLLLKPPTDDIGQASPIANLVGAAPQVSQPHHHHHHHHEQGVGGVGASVNQGSTLAPIGVALSSEAAKNYPHHHEHHHQSNGAEIKAVSGENVYHHNDAHEVTYNHNGTHNGTHHHNGTHNGIHHHNGKSASINGPLPSFAARDGRGSNAQWPLHPIHSGGYFGLNTNEPVYHKNHHKPTETSTLTPSPVPAPTAIVVSDPDHAI